MVVFANENASERHLRGTVNTEDARTAAAGLAPSGSGPPSRLASRPREPTSIQAKPYPSRPRAFLLLLGIPQRACGGVFFGGKRPSVSRPQLHLQEKCSKDESVQLSTSAKLVSSPVRISPFTLLATPGPPSSPNPTPPSPAAVRTRISSCLPLPVENCTLAKLCQNAVSHSLPTQPPPFAHRLHQPSVGRWENPLEISVADPSFQTPLLVPNRFWKPRTLVPATLHAVLPYLSTLPPATTVTTRSIYPFTLFVEALFPRHTAVSQQAPSGLLSPPAQRPQQHPGNSQAVALARNPMNNLESGCCSQ